MPKTLAQIPETAASIGTLRELAVRLAVGGIHPRLHEPVSTQEWVALRRSLTAIGMACEAVSLAMDRENLPMEDGS